MSNSSVLGRNGALVRHSRLMAKALEAKTEPDALQRADSVNTHRTHQIDTVEATYRLLRLKL